MRTYISKVTINAGAVEARNAARIEVDADGLAELTVRYPDSDRINRRAQYAIACQECREAGLVEWRQVGPQGGEDTVLMATAELMEQLAPTFLVKISIAGEE